MKLEDFDILQASKTFWKKGHGKKMSSRGTSGGMDTFWDNSKFDLIEEESNTHWIFTKFVHRESSHHVSLFNLYVPILLSKKRSCWDSWNSLLGMCNPENVIIAGDLNITLAVEEKK